MFVFRKVFPFTWTVKVPDGVVPAFEFRAKFESIPQSKLDEINAAHPLTPDSHIAALVFKGWPDGELHLPGASESDPPVPMPSTPENVAHVIDQPFLRLAIVQAYFAAMNGLLAKN